MCYGHKRPRMIGINAFTGLAFFGPGLFIFLFSLRLRRIKIIR